MKIKVGDIVIMQSTNIHLVVEKENPHHFLCIPIEINAECYLAPATPKGLRPISSRMVSKKKEFDNNYILLCASRCKNEHHRAILKKLLKERL